MSYERLLNKDDKPTYSSLFDYAGDSKHLWMEFGKRLGDICPVQTTIRFPYGIKYGWSIRYGHEGKSSKHICDAFAENGSFTVHFRIDNNRISRVYSGLSDYSKNICDNKYPCGDGGWLSYRVLSQEHLTDVLALLAAKLA